MAVARQETRDRGAAVVAIVGRRAFAERENMGVGREGWIMPRELPWKMMTWNAC